MKPTRKSLLHLTLEIKQLIKTLEPNLVVITRDFADEYFSRHSMNTTIAPTEELYDGDKIAQFCSITEKGPDTAVHYMSVSLA